MSKEIATAFWFASESSDKTYQALLYTDRSTSCECPAWKFRKKTTAAGERTCRHTRDIQAGIAESTAKKFVVYKPIETIFFLRAKEHQVSSGHIAKQDERRRVFDLE